MEVLVLAAKHVKGADCGIPDAAASDHVVQLAEALLVEGGARAILGRHLLR